MWLEPLTAYQWPAATGPESILVLRESAASSKNTEEFADVLPGAQQRTQTGSGLNRAMVALSNLPRLGATAVDPELHKGFPRWARCPDLSESNLCRLSQAHEGDLRSLKVYMDSSAGDMIR